MTAHPTTEPATAQAPETDGPPTARRRPIWAAPAIVAAVIVVAGLAVIGIYGLLQNPVGPTVGGVTTLTGTFQSIHDCGAGCVDGYVEAGGRDVFVQLPAGCPDPEGRGTVVIHGRPDPGLGSQAYLATGCASTS